MENPQKLLKDNLERLRERITQAALRSGRRSEDVTLVAVSKTIEPGLILKVLDFGVKILGENRIQEAQEKWLLLQSALHRVNGEFHLVGHLQTNKVKEAVSLFDLIHSLDSERLAAEIDRRAGEIGKVQRVLIEVNTSGELTKFGVEPEKTNLLIQVVRRCKNLKLEGLMTIGPLSGGLSATRHAFQQLRTLRDASGFADLLPHLSMGMTQDYEVAIEEGATMIRVGTAIFGDRRP